MAVLSMASILIGTATFSAAALATKLGFSCWAFGTRTVNEDLSEGLL
jgi:hypothetical protein